MTHRGIRTHDLDNAAQHCTIRHLYQLRYRDNPKKDCSNSADIGIGYCSTHRILSSFLCVALFPFANESLSDSENISEITQTLGVRKVYFTTTVPSSYIGSEN